MTTISEPLHLDLCAGRAPAGRVLAPRDAAALRARGHDVRLTASPAPCHESVPADVVLAYSPDDVVRLAAERRGPILQLNADPATARAAGVSGTVLDAAYAATSFHAAPSPGAQREILLEHGGRCWLVPPGIPPALAPAGTPRSDGAPLRVGVVEPYPVPWIIPLIRDAEPDATYVVTRIPLEDGTADLADLDVIVLPSLGPADGAAWLASEIAARGVPLLLADAEPLHALLPAGVDGACVIPAGDVGALRARLAALATYDDRLARLAAALGAIRAGRPLARRVDALERALVEIVRHSRAGTGSKRPPAVWLPRGHGCATTSRYTFAAQLARERRVLDVGCGDGRHSVRLADAGARVVIGVDACPDTIARARRLREREGRVTFACMPPDTLDIPAGTIDLVLALDGFDTIPDPHAFAEEAARVLVRNGTLLVALDNARADAQEPALRDGTSPLEPLRELLAGVFGHVAVFAERAGSWGTTVRGGTPDAERDTGWILLATRPARLPSDGSHAHGTTHARARNRRVA